MVKTHLCLFPTYNQLRLQMSLSNGFLQYLVRHTLSGWKTMHVWLRAAGLREPQPRSREAVKEQIDSQVKNYSFLGDYAGSRLLSKVASISENPKHPSVGQTAQSYLTRISVLFTNLKNHFDLSDINEVGEFISTFNTQEQFSLNLFGRLQMILNERLQQSSKLSPTIKSAAEKLKMKILNLKYQVFEKNCNPDKMIETTEMMIRQLDQMEVLEQEDKASYQRWTMEYAKYCEDVYQDKGKALDAYQQLMEKPFFKDLPGTSQCKVLMETVRLHCEIQTFKELPESGHSKKRTDLRLV